MSSKIYDEECIQRYGIKTCLVAEIGNDIYELRLLDDYTFYETINRSNLYYIIPEMLKKHYTVIMVQKIKESLEITAVHLPVQSYLNTPPIIQ